MRPPAGTDDPGLMPVMCVRPHSNVTGGGVMRGLAASITVAFVATVSFAREPVKDYDDGKALPFVSVPHVVKSTGDAVKDLAQSRHGTSFEKNFIIAVKDGG